MFPVAVDKLTEKRYNIGNFVNTMRLPTSISSILERQNGTITSQDIARAGISRTMLGKYVSSGLLERSARGIYSSIDAIPDELLIIAKRCPRLVFSHTTAAFLHAISERTPFDHTISIPSSQTIPASLRAEVKCFYVKDDICLLGKISMMTQFGNAVPCDDLERTVCDLIRDRSRIGEEDFLAAIKNYFKSDKKNLQRLGSYAEKMKIAKKVNAIMELMP